MKVASQEVSGGKKKRRLRVSRLARRVVMKYFSRNAKAEELK